MTEINENPIPTVTVTVPDLSTFGFILQQGFKIPIKPGCRLKQLLCDQFGIKSDYVDQRIKTVFLNGKPVDDYETAVVTDGATLALSAAMPGLVGATFRSGGILSPFRSSISFRNTDAPVESGGQAIIAIKLFNLLVKELGPGFLKKGIIVPLDVFNSMLPALKQQTKTIGIDGALFDPDQALIRLLEYQPDQLQLIAHKGS